MHSRCSIFDPSSYIECMRLPVILSGKTVEFKSDRLIAGRAPRLDDICVHAPFLDMSDCAEDFWKSSSAQRLPWHCPRTAQDCHRPFEQKLIARARAPGKTLPNNFRSIIHVITSFNTGTIVLVCSLSAATQVSCVLQAASMPVHCQATRSEAPQVAKYRPTLERTSSGIAATSESRLHVTSISRSPPSFKPFIQSANPMPATLIMNTAYHLCQAILLLCTHALLNGQLLFTAGRG